MNYEEEYEEMEPHSDTCRILFKKLKKGDYLIINSRPCRITSIAKSFSPINGEVLVTGLDLFDSNKHQGKFPISSMTEVPFVKTSVFQLISIDNDKSVTLLDIQGNTKADVKLPFQTNEEKAMSQRIIEGFNKGREVLVTTLYSMGLEKIIDFKIV